MNMISDHHFSETSEREFTISVGIAGIPDEAIETSENLIHSADLAMYDAKVKGRNRIEIA